MKVKNTDELIDSLYQERKHSLTAPQINILSEELTEPASIKTQDINTSRFSWHKAAIVLAGGSFMSFGILALISHFATFDHKKFEQIHPSKTASIELVDEIKPDISVTLENDKKAISALIEQPSSTHIEQAPLVKADETQPLDVTNAIKLPVVSLQQEHVPELTLLTQVLPKVHQTLDKNGMVKLRYNISPQGKVQNIKVLAATVNKQIQKQAVNALAQWQYVNHQQSMQDYYVIFAFNSQAQ